MLLISIDVGKDGACSLWENDCLVTTAEWKYDSSKLASENILEIYNLLSKTIGKLNGIMVIEKPHTSLPYQWIMYFDLREMARRRKFTFKSFKATEIKKAATGSGKADKEEVRKAVEAKGINTDGLSEHGVDSIACGLAYIKRSPEFSKINKEGK